MKILKRGFTLAEVLITIGMIGVIAAVTLPTLFMDNSEQQLGAKLAGFTSQLENIARHYSDDVDLTVFNDLLDVLDTEYIFQDAGDLEANKEKNLNDGTSIIVSNSAPTEYSGADSDAGETPASGIIEFKPQIRGLDGQTSFKFYITQKGMVYPEGSDGCTIALYEANYKTRSVYKANCSR